VTAALPQRCDVVVVGGGVIGTSIAFHLAEAGSHVVLVERDALASGSTGRAAGGVRAQFSDPLNIALGARSLERFRSFAVRPGGEIDLRLVGYLFLLDRPEDVAAFERSVALQNDHGVPSRLVDPVEARLLSPLAGVDGVIAAAFSPDDGYATTEAVVQGYAAAARGLGATIATGCELQTIVVRSGEIGSVGTSRGTVETSIVVCAAGAWSPAIGELVGVELPVRPTLREIGFTGPMTGAGTPPLTVDFTTGFYFHGEGPGLLFGMADPDTRPGFDTPRDPDWLAKVLAVAERRLPALLDAGIAGGWSGFYEVTPDHNALIGEATSVSRFLYATGFSGHGFLQGPAVGEIVRDLVLERSPFIDVAPFAVERFDQAAPRPELHVI
jgi:sarcosine oxidase, subunit beta